MSHDKKHAETTAVTTSEADLKTQALAIAQQAEAMAQQMAETGIEAGDLEIPKIMLMQNTSELVGDERAKLGDLVNTMTEEVIGGFTQTVEIVPLKLFKTLRIYDMSGAQPKLMRAEPLTSENAKLPWEGMEGDIPIKRVTNMNFFVLLKKEILDGSSFPLVVSFKSTGMQAGKQLATHLFKLVALNRLPYSQSVLLTSSKEKKDTNTYAVFGIGKGMSLTPEQVMDAKSWLVRLASMNVRIHEVQEEGETGGANRGPAPAPYVISGDASGVEGPY